MTFQNNGFGPRDPRELGVPSSTGMEEIITRMLNLQKQVLHLEQKNSQLENEVALLRAGKNTFVVIEGKYFWLQPVPDAPAMPVRPNSGLQETLVIDSIDGRSPGDPQPTQMMQALQLSGPQPAVSSSVTGEHSLPGKRNGGRATDPHTVTVTPEWLAGATNGVK